jgi:prepilin-type processing-associated H-X9-DG protein
LRTNTAFFDGHSSRLGTTYVMIQTYLAFCSDGKGGAHLDQQHLITYRKTFHLGDTRSFFANPELGSAHRPRTTRQHRRRSRTWIERSMIVHWSSQDTMFWIDLLWPQTMQNVACCSLEAGGKASGELCGTTIALAWPLYRRQFWRNDL